MRVYSTKNFLTLLTASIIIALALTYALTSLAPSYLSPKSPSYTLSSNPTSLQVSPGSAGSYTLKFTSQNGFAGSLKLAARVPNAPNILAISISPTEVPLSSGETASVTLNVATNPVTPAGSYSIAIDGTSGTLSQTNT